MIKGKKGKATSGRHLGKNAGTPAGGEGEVGGPIDTEEKEGINSAFRVAHF